MRVPFIPNDSENLGGAIHRLIPKFTRGQVRFYCKVFTSKQKARYVSDSGDEKHKFQANVHLGKSKIAQLFKKGAQILGLEEADQFYPHSLRAMFITSLANSGLNADEIMASARHTAFASSAAYIVSDGQSENENFKALGMNASPKKIDSIAGGSGNGECPF